MLGLSEILKHLPHRYPFLLIDRVEKFDSKGSSDKVGNTILAIKNVSFNEPFFLGHFPHRPIMPGVLQIEAMCQAAALACLLDGQKDKESKDFVLAKIDKAKFKSLVEPGDVLKIQAEVIRSLKSMVCMKAFCQVKDKLVSECEIVGSFLEG